MMIGMTSDVGSTREQAAMLNRLNVVSARHPIEALWRTLAKSDKKLPGYWDGKARRIRRDEAAKGRAWFAASGWQQRSEKLFALAGAVERKLAVSAPRARR